METAQSSLGYLSAIKTGNDALTEVAAEGICDLRRDVAKAESDIRETIHNQSLANGNEFCGLNKNVKEAECAIIKNDNDIAHRSTIHLNSVERDLQNRIHENRQVLTSLIGDKTERILDRVDRDTEILRTQMFNFERSTAEKFCDVKTQVKDSERRILDQLAADKLDEKNNEIAELRAEKYQDRFGYQFGLQNQEIASLKQMINSVEQTQKFASKTVQFGAGNVAIPTQTANQG